jgi:hypothetical protein
MYMKYFRYWIFLSPTRKWKFYWRSKKIDFTLIWLPCKSIKKNLYSFSRLEFEIMIVNLLFLFICGYRGYSCDNLQSNIMVVRHLVHVQITWVKIENYYWEKLRHEMWCLNYCRLTNTVKSNEMPETFCFIFQLSKPPGSSNMKLWNSPPTFVCIYVSFDLCSFPFTQAYFEISFVIKQSKIRT